MLEGQNSADVGMGDGRSGLPRAKRGETVQNIKNELYLVLI